MLFLVLVPLTLLGLGGIAYWVDNMSAADPVPSDKPSADDPGAAAPIADTDASAADPGRPPFMPVLDDLGPHGSLLATADVGRSILHRGPIDWMRSGAQGDLNTDSSSARTAGVFAPPVALVGSGLHQDGSDDSLVIAAMYPNSLDARGNPIAGRELSTAQRLRLDQALATWLFTMTAMLKSAYRERDLPETLLATQFWLNRLIRGGVMYFVGAPRSWTNNAYSHRLESLWPDKPIPEADVLLRAVAQLPTVLRSGAPERVILASVAAFQLWELLRAANPIGDRDWLIAMDDEIVAELAKTVVPATTAEDYPFLLDLLPGGYTVEEANRPDPVSV